MHGALRHTGEGAHPRPPSPGDTRVQPGVFTFVLSPTQKNKDCTIMGKMLSKEPEEEPIDTTASEKHGFL